MKLRDYPSDVTSGQRQVIRQLLPQRSKRGCPPVNRWEVLNAILYVVRTGCQWRQLPHNFPNWNTVYTVYCRWRRAGVWNRVHGTLGEKVRKASDK